MPTACSTSATFSASISLSPLGIQACVCAKQLRACCASSHARVSRACARRGRFFGLFSRRRKGFRACRHHHA